MELQIETKDSHRKFSKRDERRRQIVRAAAALFIKKGYLKTTVREIAEHCGMNVGTLYYYIGSKKNILSLFLDAVTESLAKVSEEILPTLRDMSPREALRRTIERYILYADELQDIIVFWYQESKNLEPSQLGRLMSQEIQLAGLFKTIFTWGIRSGDFELDDLDMQAHCTVVLCDMWCFRRWFFRKRYTLEQYSRLLTDFVLGGISAKRG